MVSADEQERAVRTIVEEKCGALSEAQWAYFSGQADYVCPTDFGEDEETSALAIIETIELARKVGLPRPKRTRPIDEQDKRAILGDEPGWWAEHCRQTVSSWRRYQQDALMWFDLDEPVSLEQASALINEGLDSQVREGPWCEIHYWSFKSVTGSRHPQFASGLTYEGPVLAPSFKVIPPVYRLARLAETLVRLSGCRPYRAVNFLLCDEPISLPYCRVDVNTAGVLTITVGSPVVLAAEVARTYQVAVESIKTSLPEVIESAPKRRRRPREKTLALVAFIDSEQPGSKTQQDWDRLRDKWNRKTEVKDKGWGCNSSKAMYEAYRRTKTEGRPDLP